MAKNIVFDLDGTVFNSLPMVLVSLRSLLQEELQREVSEVEVREGFRSDMRYVASYFGLNIEPESERLRILKRWSELNGAHLDKVEVFEGILPLLEELKGLDRKLFVWTARDRRSSLELLERADIMAFFEDIRCADDGLPKPNPQGILEMLQDPKEAWLIGDSEVDFEASKNCGCQFLAADWCEMAPKELLLELGQNHFVSRPQECLKFF